MKVYLYDPATGLYAGEDFRARAEFEASDSCTLAPPPPWLPGSVPLFDRDTGSWRIVSCAEMGGKGGENG